MVHACDQVQIQQQNIASYKITTWDILETASGLLRKTPKNFPALGVFFCGLDELATLARDPDEVISTSVTMVRFFFFAGLDVLATIGPNNHSIAANVVATST